MKITRMSGLIALLAVGALTLSACGSDNNTTTTSSRGRPPRHVRGRFGVVGGRVGGVARPVRCGRAVADLRGVRIHLRRPGSLRSSGSTAQGKVMEQWISDFNAKCEANLNSYGGGGSGKGIADFIANQVDFAGSDSALNADQASQAQEHPVREQRGDQPADGHRPDRAGVQPVRRGQADPDPGGAGRDLRRHHRQLERPGDRRGQPRASRCRRWRSSPCTARRTPAPPTTSPSTCAAASGGAWTAPGWKSWTAPGGVAAQGSDGVSKQIKSTDGSIGYVEWGFAQDDDLSVAQIDNGGGAVELTAESRRQGGLRGDGRPGPARTWR